MESSLSNREQQREIEDYTPIKKAMSINYQEKVRSIKKINRVSLNGNFIDLDTPR